MKRVLIIPCSGIGKVYGSISREAALQIVEKLRPEQTETMCLSLLVMGDADASSRLQGRTAITIDGCGLACARKNVEMAGGRIGASIMVLDVYRKHKDLKTQATTFLDEKGLTLAHHVAQETLQALDALDDGREDDNA